MCCWEVLPYEVSNWFLIRAVVSRIVAKASFSLWVIQQSRLLAPSFSGHGGKDEAKEWGG
jgi:hypothetical protein